MQYRKFGRLDWEASVLGFGSMRLPLLDNDMANVDVPQSIKMIRYAIDHGVNYVDTAYPYHMGKSEVVVGQALQDGYRQKVKLATKLPSFIVQSADDFDRLLNEQLKRLNTEHIDFYLLHGLNLHFWRMLRDLGVLDWAERKIAGGKIGHLGFSFHDSYKAFKEIIDAYDKWTFCQIQYNYMDTSNQAGTWGLRYAVDKGLAVVIMEPIRGGGLSKAVPASIQNIWDKSRIKRTPAEWALLWVWNHPEVTLALSGMSSMKQVIENVITADKAKAGLFSEAEIKLVQNVRRTYRKLAPVPCTGCKYCMPCPNGVDIPRNFEIYNDAFIYNDAEACRFVYKSPINKAHQAGLCVECGDCLEKCPQGLQIPDLLNKVHSFLG
ncbi:MAG TPA: aldo/keto reductase [Dehalococcoidia bacterium]|nr:aldo/keto reductase [Dehalococcoidia bacterium]